MQSGAERTGTECQPVMRVINRMEKPVDIFLTGHNTRQAQYLERGIVRMDAHIYIVLITHRHDSLQEIT